MPRPPAAPYLPPRTHGRPSTACGGWLHANNGRTDAPQNEPLDASATAQAFAELAEQVNQWQRQQGLPTKTVDEVASGFIKVRPLSDRCGCPERASQGGSSLPSSLLTRAV